MKKYGIMADIYRPSFSNGLNKFRHKTMVAVPADKPTIAPNSEIPAVEILTTMKDGKEYTYAEPLIKEEGEVFSFGWSFIYTNSPEFPCPHPIPLHDYRVNLELPKEPLKPL